MNDAGRFPLEADRHPVRVMHVLTVPMSLRFLRGQADYMRSQKLELEVACSPGRELSDFGAAAGVEVHEIEMVRRIAPLHDLIALVRLVRLFRRRRPRIVHANTPKAGLLGILAAALAVVPVRVYQMRGLPFMTATGLLRSILRLSEKTACALAHRVICNSHSLREVAVAERICDPARIIVLGSGSGNGVDAEGEYNPQRFGYPERAKIRRRFGIADDAVVVLFVGRIVRDKGIADLASAWEGIRNLYPAVHLLLVGPEEGADPIPAGSRAALERDGRVHFAGLTQRVAPFYTAADLLVLPTYREGFPNVLLEASAMELPVVATRIPGCVDAVLEGTTGTLVPGRCPSALADAIKAYLDAPLLRRSHGAAGRAHVLKHFRPERVWGDLFQEYARLLGSSAMAQAPERQVAAAEAVRRS